MKYNIIIILIILFSIAGCKNITLYSADGKKNEACFVDNTCNKGLICNSNKICVEKIIESETVEETLTTNIDNNKKEESKEDINNKNNNINDNKNIEENIEKENNQIKKKENKEGSTRVLGATCKTVSDCNSSRCIKYQNKNYRCTQTCKFDNECGDSMPICNDWLKLCVPFE